MAIWKLRRAPQSSCLIEHLNGHESVRWATVEEIAADFRRRYPSAGSARPKER